MSCTLMYIIYNKYGLKIRVWRLYMEFEVVIYYLLIFTMYYKLTYPIRFVLAENRITLYYFHNSASGMDDIA